MKRTRKANCARPSGLLPLLPLVDVSDRSDRFCVGIGDHIFCRGWSGGTEFSAADVLGGPIFRGPIIVRQTRNVKCETGVKLV